MNGPARISLLLPTRRRAAELRLTLEALAATVAHPGFVELIAYADHHDSPTLAVLDEFPSRVIVGQNDGYAALPRLINEMAELATGDWLFVFADDVGVDTPAWDDVAKRCLSCANCTSVCPTCFCCDVDDTSDVHGVVSRRRSWSSCFELDHSYLHGGAVRHSTSSRYRQWATHKFSTWWDQFGTSGCVGCGRCVTWCPVGIDVTTVVNEVSASSEDRPNQGGGETL